ncbi:MAG: glycoside hydrolase family 99-like domain-containing protein [Verrucomicrobiota bacterium]
MRVLLSLLLGSSFFQVGTNAEELSVGAYYYPWYDSDGRHWEQGYEGVSEGKKPAAGEYSSRSAEVVRQHLSWSENLGIDHWICSWWGPNSWEDVTVRDYVLPILDSSETSLKFCMLYESAGLLGMNAEEGIELSSRSIQTRFAEHFAYLAQTYFSHDRYVRVNGKPVVYLYLSRCFTGEYSDALQLVREVVARYNFELYLVGDEVYWGEPDATRIATLDAITAYNMHGPAEFADLEDWTPFVKRSEEVYERYRNVAKRFGVHFVPGILPGFDSRESGGDHYAIPRTIFPAYREMARRQLDSDLNTVVITSFNEWHEGTQLEPFEGDTVEPVFSDGE